MQKSKNISKLEALSIMINGKVTEAMDRKGLSKAELSEKLNLGKEALQRRGREKTLATLDFITVNSIVEAAGYEIEFQRKF